MYIYSLQVVFNIGFNTMPRIQHHLISAKWENQIIIVIF